MILEWLILRKLETNDIKFILQVQLKIKIQIKYNKNSISSVISPTPIPREKTLGGYSLCLEYLSYER